MLALPTKTVKTMRISDAVYTRAQAGSFRVIQKTEAPDLIVQVVRQSVARQLRASMVSLRR